MTGNNSWQVYNDEIDLEEGITDYGYSYQIAIPKYVLLQALELENPVISLTTEFGKKLVVIIKDV